MMDWPIHIIRALQIIMQIIMVPVGYLMLLKHIDGSYEHWPMAVIVTVAWLAILKMQYDKIGEWPMSKEAQQQHLAGAIAVATEALQHLERGSVVAVKYDEGAAMEVEGPARVTFKLEVEALDLPFRNITRTQEKFLPDDPRSPAKTAPLDETTIRSILMGVFLGSTTLTIDRAVKKLLDAQDGGR